eukprot:jgi/Mesvir1/7072/Mv09184-RA.1
MLEGEVEDNEGVISWVPRPESIFESSDDSDALYSSIKGSAKNAPSVLELLSTYSNNWLVVDGKYGRYERLKISGIDVPEQIYELPGEDTNPKITARQLGSLPATLSPTSNSPLPIFDQRSPTLGISRAGSHALASELDRRGEDKERDKVLALALSNISVLQCYDPCFSWLSENAGVFAERTPVLPVRPSAGVRRFRVSIEPLSFEIAAFEPLYGRVALYDIVKKQKLSEDFHFDATPHFSKNKGMPSSADSDAGGGLHTCLFSVNDPSSDVVALVMLDRSAACSQGALKSKYYTHKEYAKLSERDKEKLRATAHAAASRMRGLRETLCWAALHLGPMPRGGARPLMEPGKEVRFAVEPLHSIKECFSDEWLMELINDPRRKPHKPVRVKMFLSVEFLPMVSEAKPDSLGGGGGGGGTRDNLSNWGGDTPTSTMSRSSQVPGARNQSTPNATTPPSVGGLHGHPFTSRHGSIASVTSIDTLESIESMGPSFASGNIIAPKGSLRSTPWSLSLDSSGLASAGYVVGGAGGAGSNAASRRALTLAAKPASSDTSSMSSTAYVTSVNMGASAVAPSVSGSRRPSANSQGEHGSFCSEDASMFTATDGNSLGGEPVADDIADIDDVEDGNSSEEASHADGNSSIVSGSTLAGRSVAGMSSPSVVAGGTGRVGFGRALTSRVVHPAGADVTASLSSLPGFGGGPGPCRALLDFGGLKRQEPHTRLLHFLYIYPVQYAGSKKRNTYVRVILRDDDLEGLPSRTPPLPAFFHDAEAVAAPPVQGYGAPPPGQTFLRNEGYSEVAWKSKTSLWHSEIKMQLPAHLTSRHHLVFSLFHVEPPPVSSSSSAHPEPVAEKLIGHAVLPLSQQVRQLAADTSLPLVSELLPRYLEENVKAHMPYVDERKPNLRIHTRMASTLDPLDPAIGDLFAAYDRVALTTTSAGASGNAPGGLMPAAGGSGSHYPGGGIGGPSAVGPSATTPAAIRAQYARAISALPGAQWLALIQYLHPVLNMLLDVFATPHAELQTAAFRSLVHIFNRVQQESSDGGDRSTFRNTMLVQYVDYIYGTWVPESERARAAAATNINTSVTNAGGSATKGGPDASSGGSDASDRPPAYIALIRTWADRLRAREAEGPRTGSVGASGIVTGGGHAYDDPFTACWVIFELVSKSIQLDHQRRLERAGLVGVDGHAHTGAGASTLRWELPADTFTQLRAVFLCCIGSIESGSKKGLSLAKRLNASLAFFCAEMLSCLVPQQTYELIALYFDNFPGRGGSNTTVLEEFMLTFLRVVCDHEDFLHLPPPFKPSPSGTLAAVGAGRNFLSTLLLKETFAALSHSERNIRTKAVRVLAYVATKHAWEAHSQHTLTQRRVADTFAPLLEMMLDDNGLATVSSLPPAEQRELLAVTCFVMRHVATSDLRAWWSGTPERSRNFFRVLELCLEAFELPGPLSPARAASQAAHAQAQGQAPTHRGAQDSWGGGSGAGSGGGGPESPPAIAASGSGTTGGTASGGGNAAVPAPSALSMSLSMASPQPGVGPYPCILSPTTQAILFGLGDKGVPVEKKTELEREIFASALSAGQKPRSLREHRVSRMKKPAHTKSSHALVGGGGGSGEGEDPIEKEQQRALWEGSLTASVGTVVLYVLQEFLATVTDDQLLGKGAGGAGSLAPSPGLRVAKDRGYGGMANGVGGAGQVAALTVLPDVSPSSLSGIQMIDDDVDVLVEAVPDRVGAGNSRQDSGAGVAEFELTVPSEGGRRWEMGMEVGQAQLNDGSASYLGPVCSLLLSFLRRRQSLALWECFLPVFSDIVRRCRFALFDLAHGLFLQEAVVHLFHVCMGSNESLRKQGMAAVVALTRGLVSPRGEGLARLAMFFTTAIAHLLLMTHPPPPPGPSQEASRTATVAEVSEASESDGKARGARSALPSAFRKDKEIKDGANPKQPRGAYLQLRRSLLELKDEAAAGRVFAPEPAGSSADGPLVGGAHDGVRRTRPPLQTSTSVLLRGTSNDLSRDLDDAEGAHGGGTLGGGANWGTRTLPWGRSPSLNTSRQFSLDPAGLGLASAPSLAYSSGGPNDHLARVLATLADTARSITDYNAELCAAPPGALDDHALAERELDLATVFCHVPDLYIQALLRLSKRHEEGRHWAEAGMCSLAVVSAVQLWLWLWRGEARRSGQGGMEGGQGAGSAGPGGARASIASSNAGGARSRSGSTAVTMWGGQGSAVFADILGSSPAHFPRASLLPRECVGVCSTRVSEAVAMDALYRSIALFKAAKLCTHCNALYKLIIPMHERTRFYRGLIDCYAGLRGVFEELERLSAMNDPNVVAKFYYVRLYGDVFSRVLKPQPPPALSLVASPSLATAAPLKSGTSNAAGRDANTGGVSAAAGGSSHGSSSGTRWVVPPPAANGDGGLGGIPREAEPCWHFVYRAPYDMLHGEMEHRLLQVYSRLGDVKAIKGARPHTVPVPAGQGFIQILYLGLRPEKPGGGAGPADGMIQSDRSSVTGEAPFGGPRRGSSTSLEGMGGGWDGEDGAAGGGGDLDRMLDEFEDGDAVADRDWLTDPQNTSVRHFAAETTLLCEPESGCALPPGRPPVGGSSKNRVMKIREEGMLRTVVAVEEGAALPCMAARLRVVSRIEVELSPLLTAVQEVKKRTAELQWKMSRERLVELEMLLQGSLRPMENPGVVPFCEAFLSPPWLHLFPEAHVRQLSNALGTFLRTCREGMAVFARLAAALEPAQQQHKDKVLRELMAGFEDLKKKLASFNVVESSEASH